MAIDPNMMQQALDEYDRMNNSLPQGRPPVPGTPPAGTSINQMMTPTYEDVQFAEAGSLPNLDLDIRSLVDPQLFMEETNNLTPEVKLAAEEEVMSVLTNAGAGEEEDGIRAVAALGLDNASGTTEEKQDAYRSISDMIDEGGIPAVEEFVRSMYTESNNSESIPEWALPASVFGTFMMNEPGDWKQAYLQAKGKTATYMFNKGEKAKADKAKLDQDIRKKALDLYASREIKTNDLLALVGKVTTDSLKTFQESGKVGDLKLVDEETNKEDLLDKFTVASVGKYAESGQYSDLIRLKEKGDKDTKVIEYLKLFTPASVADYEKGGRQDSSLLVRKPGKGENDLSELTGLLEDHTAASVEEFKNSGYDFSLLVKKTDNGLIGGDSVFGSDSSGTMMNNITNMIKSDYIEKLKTADLDTKIDQLNTYAGLYKATSDTQITKTGALDTLKERQPFVNVTPKQFATQIGLDLNDPKIAELARIPVNLLPTAPAELATRYLANKSLRNKMELVGGILTNAPANVVGIKGELLDTNAARILSDITGFKIPEDFTLTKVLLNVAEIDLIEGIIKEDRFTEADRKMVREFIKGDSYKTQAEALIRYKEVMEVIDRTETVIMNQLEGNYKPITTMSSEDQSLQNKERIARLMELSKGS